MSERLPALTADEADVLDHDVRVLELLARLNPARTASTVSGGQQAAQALVSAARALEQSLSAMRAHGQDEVFTSDLARVLRSMGADRHLARLDLPG